MNPANPAVMRAAARDSHPATPSQRAIYPQTFSLSASSDAADVYLNDPAARKLAEFFEVKGLPALKSEDQREEWYADWLAYQAEHRLYASLLAPKAHSALGTQFDLLRYARFLELIAYFSPAHGYSLQVTFLGFFSIMMGSSTPLKQEAVRALEAGGIFALGVSEKQHGSDLLGNEFTVTDAGPGKLIASGSKYYIGNCNAAAMISILAKHHDGRSNGRVRRAPMVLLALRPAQSRGFGNVQKIRTIGVRSAFVGAFDVKGHELPETDLIAQGRDAWDAVFGTVTLGKFFLGFGSIGICEHAFAEAAHHLATRMLFGKPVLQMPHIRSLSAQAYARLAAMKLYAYRALDYVHAATADDRRYLLFNAVQKAKVGVEGVKVMALLSECIGAKGFESDTYFEMALRDAQLIPGLEGSTHINLGVTAQFIPMYFARGAADLAAPPSLAAGEIASEENAYLMEAASTSLNAIAFPRFLKAYGPLMSIPNVRLFVRQARRFALLVRKPRTKKLLAAGTETALTLGQCMATIAYGQLVAENSVRFSIEPELVAAMFHGIISDMTASALALAAFDPLDAVSKLLIRRLVAIPRTRSTDWDFVSERVARKR